jgi:hypothetical protein
VPSSEYLRKQADLYLRLSFATQDEDRRAIFAERALCFTAQAEMVEAEARTSPISGSAEADEVPTSSS